ncbi:PIG-L deacetylase family protein [Paenibacillus cymbidii]|uniref:PIG-L deacetylase family protein n=1 Tax=Paenibacillus cymbidii TaxID=1639034 RepID=UPI001081393D|nr:PIG-L family deacetylase [Paenibacillus cymbidii]
MADKRLRVLMIGAHPDDCEFRTGGIGIKYRQLGHEVAFVSVTNGNAGHHEASGHRLAQIRRREAADACAVAGIESRVLDIDDGKLETDLRTRERIIKLIRVYKPDLIFTHRPNDYHPDHRNTAVLVQDSAYAIIVPAICPLTPALDYRPIVLYMHDDFRKPAVFEPSVVVDIDDVMPLKTQMLHRHASQLYEWLPWTSGTLSSVPAGEAERLEWLGERMRRRDGHTAERFRQQLVERYGEERGSRVQCAEAFEVSEYGGSLPAERMSFYFPF